MPVSTWPSEHVRGLAEQIYGPLASSRYVFPANAYGRRGHIAAHAIVAVMRGALATELRGNPRNNNFIHPVLYEHANPTTHVIDETSIVFRGLVPQLTDQKLPDIVRATNLVLADVHSDLRLAFPPQLPQA